jgi:hypothetical protein
MVGDVDPQLLVLLFASRTRNFVVVPSFVVHMSFVLVGQVGIVQQQQELH